jgi:hypothetical protein
MRRRTVVRPHLYPQLFGQKKRKNRVLTVQPYDVEQCQWLSCTVEVTTLRSDLAQTRRTPLIRPYALAPSAAALLPGTTVNGGTALRPPRPGLAESLGNLSLLIRYKERWLTPSCFRSMCPLMFNPDSTAPNALAVICSEAGRNRL